MQSIRVLLADDHSIFRKGVRSILEEDREITVIGEAANGLEALEKVRDLAPDVLLVDINMPKMNGIEVAKIVSKQFAGTKALVLSMHNDQHYILKAVESGALGYLLKDTTKEDMISAVKTVNRGDKYFNGFVSNTIVDGYLNKAVKVKAKSGIDDSKSKLSKKEKVIVNYIIEGLSSKQIAERENLSVRTVDNHRANMMRKLGVKNAAELVKLALEEKLL
ncbi:MAG: response regulator transcription factor [Cytophagales bacterium]